MKLPKFQMKRSLKIAFILALTLASCTGQKVQLTDGEVSNLEDLLKDFGNPPGEYGSAPLYSWNDKITKEGIAYDLKEMKNSGFGGVFIHPRPGLVTEYLSDEWFDLFRFTVREGKKLDMHVSIYDEDSYPSGFAGGHVSVEMPEAESNGQGLMPTVADKIPDDYKKYYLILKKDRDKYTDITSTAGNEKEPGEYVCYEKTFYSKTWYGNAWFGRGKNNKSSYVDLLMQGVSEKFIDITFADGYEKAFGEEFGKTVKYIFTDEPEIGSPGGNRWTPDLFDVFEKQWNYDLKVNLPSLTEKIGDWKKVRHNYAKTLLWLFIERWAKPNYNYCEAKGLKYTGHYWEHGWPAMQLGPDNMAMAAYQQMPGVDMLFNQFNEVSNNAQFGNIRSIKEVVSVANQLGRNRILSESHAGSGNDLTFESMKMLGDWQYALGINFLNQFYYYSLSGSRKYDYPLSFDYHAPWWEEYKYLNEYYKHLSYALSSGKQMNEILVIEPTSTAWMYDSYVKKDREALTKIGLSFQLFVTNLEKNQVEYDLGSEDIINNHGSVEDKHLVVGQRKYSKVVLPPNMENLNESTFKILKEFVNEGGELITFSKPSRINGGESSDNFSIFENTSVKYLQELNRSVILDNFTSEDFKLMSINGGNLFHNRRLLNDGQILFLTNASLRESSTGEIRLKGKDAILLDAFTGKIEDYTELNDKNYINISFSLSPSESLLLFISNKKLKKYKLRENNAVVALQAESSLKTERSGDNVLVLDFCDLKVAGKTLQTGLHTGVALLKAYEDNGCSSSNPWGSTIQYKTNILEKSKEFNENSGFTATYNFFVDEIFDYDGFTAIVERPEIWKVYINGNLTAPIQGAWKIDKSFGVYPVGKSVVKGKNSIEIRCYPMNIFAEIAPVYLMGNFSLEAAKQGWKVKSPATMLKTGSWKAQGYPFYPWGMKYKKYYQIKDNSKKFIVKAGEWKGSVARVSVNGQKAGTVILQTDKLDVSQLIKKGENEIVLEIIGSFKNLTGPFHNNHPKGMAGPRIWDNVGNYPSGIEYELIDYGLMDNFDLFVKD
jgi:hypothetical protein